MKELISIASLSIIIALASFHEWLALGMYLLGAFIGMLAITFNRA